MDGHVHADVRPRDHRVEERVQRGDERADRLLLTRIGLGRSTTRGRSPLDEDVQALDRDRRLALARVLAPLPLGRLVERLRRAVLADDQRPALVGRDELALRLVPVAPARRGIGVDLQAGLLERPVDDLERRGRREVRVGRRRRGRRGGRVTARALAWPSSRRRRREQPDGERGATIGASGRPRPRNDDRFESRMADGMLARASHGGTRTILPRTRGRPDLPARPRTGGAGQPRSSSVRTGASARIESSVIGSTTSWTCVDALAAA